MKTQKEIEEKYEELNKRMSDNMPTESSNKELASLKDLTSIEHLDVFEKMAKRSVDGISIDAQRYILEWVLGNND